jgi:hypothetical protein
MRDGTGILYLSIGIKKKEKNNEPATTKNLESQNETVSTTSTTSTPVP